MEVTPPAVSIGVCAYNAEKTISKCINSILEQNFTDYEIVIVNDGSTDGTAVLLAEYAVKHDCIKLITKANGGIAAARNDVLANAEGEYIGWADADDWVAPDMFLKLWNTAKANEADMVLCGHYEVHADGLKEIQPRYYAGPLEVLDDLMYERLDGYLPTKLLRLRLIQINNLAFTKGMNMAEDKAMVMKYAAVCNVVAVVNEPLYYYNRLNEDSITSITDAARKKQLDEQYFFNLVEGMNYVMNAGTSLSEEKIKEYKLLTKKNYLFNHDIASFKKWAETYPEVNKMGHITPRVGNLHRIVAVVSANNLWLLIKIYCWLRRTINTTKIVA